MFKIGIDVDNTISAYPDVFSKLTLALSAFFEIHIITYRENREETVLYLKKMNIKYDKLALVDNKEDYILKNNIKLFIDDTDEFFQNLPQDICVLKIREDGNFDFNDKKWIYAAKTGRTID